MAARHSWRELHGIYLPQRKNVSVVPECLVSGLCRASGASANDRERGG
jgi:hypothetical protein